MSHVHPPERKEKCLTWPFLASGTMKPLIKPPE